MQEKKSEKAASDGVAVAVALPPPDEIDSLSSMLKQVAMIAAPTIGGTILNFANSVITIMFVGQTLGVITLAQFSVSLTVYNVCGYSLGIGFAAALDTLASQAYGRNQQGQDVGDIFQRALLLNCILLLPIIVCFLEAEPLIVWIFGSEVGIGAAAALRCCPIPLVIQTINCLLQKILQAQKLAHLPMYATCISTVMCIVFNFFLVHRGLCYAMLSIALTNLISCLYMAAMCIWHPRVVVRLCPWPSPNLLDLGRLRQHLRIAFAAMCAICGSWWAFEFLAIIAAQLGTRQVAATNILLNVDLMLFAIPSGFAQAMSALVGNCLGAYQPQRAFAFFSLILRSVLCGAFAAAVFLLAYGKWMVSLFTTDEETIKMIDDAMTLIASFYILDSVQGTTQGAFRGVGLQAAAAKVSLATLWLIGLPAAAIFALCLGFDYSGIIIGFIVGLAVQVPVLVHLTRQWDWYSLATKAAKKEHKGSEGGAAR